MSELHSKNGDSKWLASVRKNLAHLVQPRTKSLKRKSNIKAQGWVLFCNAIQYAKREPALTLISIAVYYVMTELMHYIAFGTFDEVISASDKLGDYYLLCAVAPITSMLLLLSHHNTLITKLLACVYFVLLCDNVVIAIDAYENLTEWGLLYTIDDFVQWTSDAVFMSVGFICILSRLLLSVLSWFFSD